MNRPLDPTEAAAAGRREDLRLAAGKGRYVGDIRPGGMLRAVFVRSPQAHARVLSVDIAEAAGAPGVALVLTGADLAAAGIRDAPGGFASGRPDGEPAADTPRPALARDRVRHVGEPVAVVFAETLAQALDAAELVEVEYDPLPHVPGVGDMSRAGAEVPLWDAAPDGIGFELTEGDAEAAAAALASAAHVTRARLSINRIAPMPMEPRGCLIEPQNDGRLLIHASHQSPFTLRAALAAVGFPPEEITVRVPDVGGSFGLKMGAVQEAVPMAHAARLLGRPISWESLRSEAFLSDEQAREMAVEAEIGFDAAWRIAGLRVAMDCDLGAYLSGKSVWTTSNLGGIAGVYEMPAIAATVRGRFSSRQQTAAYRGAGRPEATYVIETLLDRAAAEMGVDPLELRRRNLIPAEAMPYRTALTFTYDCGDFAAGMAKAEALGDVAGFPARRAASEARGMLRGLGFCNSIEIAGGPFGVYAPDICRVSLMRDGRLRVESGSTSVGQGFETVFPDLVAARFGVEASEVIYAQGDTDRLPWGRGNGGSSMLCVGGAAVQGARDTLAARLIELAAPLLEAAPEEVALEDGMLRAGNRGLTLAELAAALPTESEPESDEVSASATAEFRPEGGTFPNGAHVCEVEIDPETGAVQIVAYAAVEDVGTVINPMTTEGRIMGGIVQGAGQALGEDLAFDEDGQLLTGSFMDYRMPRAADFPEFKLAFNPVPTAVNPLGAKGVGEAGTVGALSAVMSAVNDALRSRGAPHLDMPATPSRIWAALQAAR